jgi:glycosyltransferase involved in cell wall biosynthesis
VSPSVLHVNDAASTARRLIGEAARRGRTWDSLPIAAPAQDWSGIGGKLRKAAIGASWVARLAVAARRHDLVHVHSATTVAHSRLGAPRYVLHCHGTDVRTTQYQPGRAAAIRGALTEAEAVFFSTPDLAEHVIPHRPDAVYLPVPIDAAEIPPWAPADGRPKVVFASRWGPEKGGQAQLDLAADLLAAVGGTAEVVGLDWGSQARDAAERGVTLVPKSDYAGYLRFLSTATVVIGQSAGILASSELEAMAAGAPLVVPVALPLYAATPPPVLGGDREAAVAGVRRVLDDPAAHDPEVGRRWVEAGHGVAGAYEVVAKVYEGVLAERR